MYSINSLFISSAVSFSISTALASYSLVSSQGCMLRLGLFYPILGNGQLTYPNNQHISSRDMCDLAQSNNIFVKKACCRDYLYSVPCLSFSTYSSMRRIVSAMRIFCGQCGSHCRQPMQCDACRSLGTARS